MTEEQPPESVDFFVSYNHADTDWAEWAAWVVEEAGYTTKVQAWDIRPGSNFVLEMHRAAQTAKRTIAILSPNYLGSDFTGPEWAAAFAHDPGGQGRKLIPVRIAPSKADGLLGQIVYIDLVGLRREAAKAALLAGLRPGRAKPVTEPSFPGGTAGPAETASDPRAAPDLAWQPLAEPPAVTWRTDLAGRNGQGSTALVELHLVPVTAQRLEVRRLAQLGDELASAGRAAGLFGTGQSLGIEADGQHARAVSRPGRQADECGLAVTRTGQRSVWFALPHDSMGAVFDPDDMAPRLAALLRVLRSLPVPDPGRVAFALRVEPLTQLSFAPASTVGRRSHATTPYFPRNSCSVNPEDAVSTAALDANTASVAEELTARLAASLGNR